MELRRFGQDTILTPLIDHKEPLIQVFREADGTYTFDYTRFDRWLSHFDGLGFRLFAGHHISMLPAAWLYGGVWYTDRTTGEKRVLSAKGVTDETWMAFLPGFYRSLREHLTQTGYLDRYIQHQLDEPKDPAAYQAIAALTRQHLPGVPTIDAINSRPDEFSPLVDIQVFALQILAKRQDLAQQRRQGGQRVWLYHCCSPYPPYPNRHLDERLPDSRLYPWLADLLGADGYLFWGANVYRGADPYKTSVGPVPSGSQNPGHPPGDNWLFYPGADGLLGSMRMVAFRDGLVDHTLLQMLRGRDPQGADALRGRIARSVTDYEKSPAGYHNARRDLLVALDEG